jgi:hypothetical protein
MRLRAPVAVCRNAPRVCTPERIWVTLSAYELAFPRGVHARHRRLQVSYILRQTSELAGCVLTDFERDSSLHPTTRPLRHT